jgi:primosomal protein N'
MPLPTFKTLEEIPEAFRPEYEQVENEWRPKAQRTDDDVQKTKAALANEREQRKAEETARKAAEKERDDLKRAREAAAKGISEEELQKIRDDEAKARKPIEEERDRLAAENLKLKRDDKGQVTADDAETFFKKFRTAKPWLFKGSGASGSGAEGSNGSGGDTKPPTKESLDEKRAQVIGAL